MATYAGAIEERTVSVGRVISRGLSALASNPVPIVGIAFVFGALPQTIISYVSQSLRLGETRVELVVTISIVSALLALVLSTLVQGALVRATITATAGGKASFGESLAAGLAVALPLVGLAILSALGLAVGFVLFVVPGVILGIMWAVAAPVLVEERRGVTEAFGRSRALTKGARWKIFGLFLVIGVVLLLLSSVLGVAIGAGGMRGMQTLSRTGFSFGWFVLNALISTVFGAIWSVLQTSLYVELRDWKDGPTTDALADIFS